MDVVGRWGSWLAETHAGDDADSDHCPVHAHSFAALDALVGRGAASSEQDKSSSSSGGGATATATAPAAAAAQQEQQAQAGGGRGAHTHGFPCTIQRVPLSELTLPLGAFDAPVVIEVDTEAERCV